MRSYHGNKVPDNVKPPSMDEVLVPCGSWKEANAKARTKYNIQFVAGVVILVATIAYVYINISFLNLIKLYLFIYFNFKIYKIFIF